MQFAEKGLHKGMPSFGDLAAQGREHLLPNPGHLDLKFPVGGVLSGVGFCICRINFRVMEPGSDLTGKKKGPAYADGPDGVQLVRIKEDLGFDGFR